MKPAQAKPVHRHKTALSRYELSKPIALALAHGLLAPKWSVLDYGCGKGSDVRLLSDLGHRAWGWDPVHAPKGRQAEADVVNLGYVINVIEDPAERAATLRRAFGLAKRALIVSAQLDFESTRTPGTPHGDGILTSRGTFQKYYTQKQLQEYVTATLGAPAVAGSLGVFFVFRDESLRQRFLLEKLARRTAPSVNKDVLLDRQVERHRQLLLEYVQCVSTLGRCPRSAGEFAALDALNAAFGTAERALKVCQRVFTDFDYESLREGRIEDLLVYLALARFQGRPQFSDLPDASRWDVKDFFGSYRAACAMGDRLLFQVGRQPEVDLACRASKVGKLLPDAFYVHVSALPEVDPVLRVLVGCAHALIGEAPNANILKIHRAAPKLSFLSYPEFDTDPHPALTGVLKVNLREQSVEWKDLSGMENPPILHRKETMVSQSYPGHATFAALTEQEVRCGLLSSDTHIGNREQWLALLGRCRLKISGNRICAANSDH